MSFDLDGKTFRVVRNDGPGAAVTTETVFRFRQEGEIVHAEYEGGGVRLGRLVGLLDGNAIRHAYVQVNTAGELQSGHGTDTLRRAEEGRIEIVDSWQWESRDGQGECVMRETSGA